MLFRKKGVSTLVELMNRKDSEEPPEEGDWILFGEGEKNAEVENFKETWKLINDGTLTAKKTSLMPSWDLFGCARSWASMRIRSGKGTKKHQMLGRSNREPWADTCRLYFIKPGVYQKTL